jgi:hypothetical protein
MNQTGGRGKAAAAAEATGPRPVRPRATSGKFGGYADPEGSLPACFAVNSPLLAVAPGVVVLRVDLCERLAMFAAEPGRKNPCRGRVFTNSLPRLEDDG